MAEFFPSWHCQLSVRFEDFGKIQIQVPKLVPTRLRGSKIDRDPLTVVPDPDAPQGVTRFLVQGKVPSQPGPASSQTSSADGMTHDVGGVIPKSFSWKQNGIRHADELQLTLKWADFPFDPRIIQACAVRFFLGTVPASDYARGIGGDSGQGSGSKGQVLPLNLVPEKFTDNAGRTRTNLRFTGWVDDYEMSWPDGEPTVKLSCRDQTQLFLTQEIPSGWHVDPTLHIDEMVAKFLANWPTFEGISVEYRPTTVRDAKTPPILKENYNSVCTPPGGGPAVSKGGGAAEKLSVWDYLTDLCGSIGHLIRLDGNVVIIQRPRNLYNGQAAPRDDDPYRARTVDGRQYLNRSFVYGRNVSEFRATRKFSKTSTAIELRCYWPDRKKTLVARAPKGGPSAAADQGTPGSGEKKGTQPVNAKPGDGKSDQKWTVMYVQGISNQEVLQQTADDAYESRNRLEIQVHMKTRDMWSFGGGNEDPDILDLKAGDTVDVLVSQDGDHSTVTQGEGTHSVFGLGKDRLVELGYTTALAESHERAFTDAGFTRSFFTREVDISGDVEQGVSFEVVGVNYVQARADGGGTTADDKAPR